MDREKRFESVRNWIATAEYDIETARHMLRSGRNIYLFLPLNIAQKS